MSRHQKKQPPHKHTTDKPHYAPASSLMKEKEQQLPTELQTFSLTNEARDGLQNALRPLIEKAKSGDLILTDKDRTLQKKAVEEFLPPEILAAVSSSMEGKNRNVIWMKNLPKETDLSESNLRNEEKTYMQHIAAGIYQTLGKELGGTADLKRSKNSDGGISFFGAPLHRDAAHLQYFFLGCFRNNEHAHNIVADIKAAVKDLSLEELSEIKLSYSHFKNMRDYVGSATDDDAIRVDLEKTTPKALKKWNEALARHSVVIDVQPGEAAFWNNDLVYHCIQQGNPEYVKDDQYRWAVRITGRDKDHKDNSYAFFK